MSDSRATRNADSLNNAAGEFNPHAPRSDPMTTHGVSLLVPVPFPF